MLARVCRVIHKMNTAILRLVSCFFFFVIYCPYTELKYLAIFSCVLEKLFNKFSLQHAAYICCKAFAPHILQISKNLSPEVTANYISPLDETREAGKIAGTFLLKRIKVETCQKLCQGVHYLHRSQAT